MDFNITHNQESFITAEQKKAVWEKGAVISGYEPNKWRRDRYGKEIKWEEYENRKSDYGWEIGHINLTSNSGHGSMHNPEPLNWENNIVKSEQLNLNYSY